MGDFRVRGNGEFVLTSVRALLKQKGTNTEKELEISKALADVEANPRRKSKLFSDYSAIAKTLNDDARNGLDHRRRKERGVPTSAYLLLKNPLPFSTATSLSYCFGIDPILETPTLDVFVYPSPRKRVRPLLGSTANPP